MRKPTDKPTPQEFIQLRNWMIEKGYSVSQASQAIGIGVSGRNWRTIREEWNNWMVENRPIQGKK